MTTQEDSVASSGKPGSHTGRYPGGADRQSIGITVGECDEYNVYTVRFPDAVLPDGWPTDGIRMHQGWLIPVDHRLAWVTATGEDEE